ncbi:hypothetical protein BC829DRAFT_437976 [Chytridium lagenaria]|nr:hypothetical protein BC829DRAFT_437976 [Chytridium lagenaria]
MSSPAAKPTTATSPTSATESKAGNFFNANPITAVAVILSLAALALAIASVPLSWVNVVVESPETFSSFSSSASPARAIAEYKIGLFEVTGCDISRSGYRTCEKVELKCFSYLPICGKINTLKGLTIASIFAALCALAALGYILDKRSKAKAAASATPNPVMQQGIPKPVAIKDPKTEEVYYVIPMPPTPALTPTADPDTTPLSAADERSVISASLFFACLVFILMLAAFIIGLDVNAEFAKNTTTSPTLTSTSPFRASQNKMLFSMGEGMGLAIGSAVASALAGLFCAHIFQSELKLMGADGAENKA